MKKGDIYIISISLVIFIVILIFYKLSLNPNGERYVDIRIKNELITSVKLSESTDLKILLLTKENQYQEYIILNQEDELPENISGYDIISIHDNGVQVLDADCPKRIIVRQGFVRYTNIPLICLPRSLSVTIVSKSINDEMDGIAS